MAARTAQRNWDILGLPLLLSYLMLGDSFSDQLHDVFRGSYCMNLGLVKEVG